MSLAVREPESEEKPQKYLNEKQHVTTLVTVPFLAVLQSDFLLIYVIIFALFRKTKMY